MPKKIDSAISQFTNHVDNGTHQSVPPIEVSRLTTVLKKTIIHQDLNLVMKPGEILGLVGASGSGKSVLLQSLIGLRRPSSGTIRILGTDVYEGEPEIRASLPTRWGIVFQDNALFSTLTILENIAIVLRKQAHVSKELAFELARTKLAMAELPTEVGNQFPWELSGGMRKRAAIARAIAADPELLLFDEPTTGLDPVVASKIDSLILQLHDSLGLSVLLITHDLDTLFRVCDRVAILAERKIVAVQAPTKLAKNEHPWIKNYFQGERGLAAAQSAKTAIQHRVRDHPSCEPE